jgi:pectinesterase
MPSRRDVLLVALGGALSGCAILGGEPAYDAIVATTGPRGGARVLPTIAAALAAAPEHATKPFRILVTKGQWRERVVITKPFIRLIGEARDESVIVFNRSAGDKAPDGTPLGTFGTATVVVRAADFGASQLSIANDFDYVAHMPEPVTGDKTGQSGAQAVALAIQDEADRAFLEDVHITGYQDTLFADAGRSLFRKCKVEGCVDFIFGAGRAVFEDCEIVSRLRPGQEFNGYIAAPDTNRRQPFGLVFTGCRLTKEAGVAAHSVALGRPWRRTGTFSDGRYGDPDAVGAAVFLNCWMDDHIVAEGWYPMGYNLKGGGRAMMQPEEARFHEFESTGPGAGVASPRRRQLTPDQARTFVPSNVLDGWSP